jgi:hypothetical protein
MLYGWSAAAVGLAIVRMMNDTEHTAFQNSFRGKEA